MARDAPTADEMLTPEQQAQILDILATGQANSIAARAVGMTGTKLKFLRKRDPGFGALCDEAEDAGSEHYVDDLRDAARNRALDPEGHPRILETELATRVPEYAHLRRDRLQIDSRIEHAIVLPDPNALETLSLDELVALRAMLAKVGGGIIEGGEIRELPPAS